MTSWRRRSFTAPGVTQVPHGPQVEQLRKRLVGSIKVTTPRYDDIGAVLTSIGVSYSSFDGTYDCDLLFMNCGTEDSLEVGQVRDFVLGGGCLYASDLTSAFVSRAFPGIFDFGGTGATGTIEAAVVDAELRAVVGPSTSIHFDMSDWSVLRGSKAETLVAAAPGSPYGEIPLMVGVEMGDGAVFYTSFHNRAQASAAETVLLQLLVLKQIGAKANLSLEQASSRVGVDLTALKAGTGGS